MWNSCVRWFIMVILCETIIGQDDCPPGINSKDTRLLRITCLLDKHNTFNPWGGKRSSNAESLESSKYQTELNSRGGKRFKGISFKSNNKDRTGKKYKIEILSCIRRFINDKFFLDRCMEVVQNECTATYCSDDQTGMERRELIAWENSKLKHRLRSSTGFCMKINRLLRLIMVPSDMCSSKPDNKSVTHGIWDFRS
ncbi:unnamed protein product [Mytilus coruscus]|uniref:Uncharacterized protein n=1 Tax=Mytilus coruscus TaxID=42192 RepID=A0A6J8AGC4_MYTCO|nr:unnamed protein product [Mytilus coruscus]